MKLALFMGCKIPFYLEHYGTSTKAVLHALGVQTVELDFNCCGYPNRDLHFESFILSAARNLALAEKRGLDMVTPCKCCFGSFKHAQYWLERKDGLKADINRELQKEGLLYEGRTQVKQILGLLARDIGLETIAKKVVHPQHGRKVAAHYGCHALRPSAITNFDNPFSPTVFEKLVTVTGAEPVEWSRRLDCCGNPLLERNKELSIALRNKKLADAAASGADFLCTACTYCQLQFDTLEPEPQAAASHDDPRDLPSVLYTQLLGLSMGLKEAVLGLNKNRLPIGAKGTTFP